MNKFLTYILPFIAALLFSCSQQSEASYVEEADEVEMAPGEIEKSEQAITYSWEVSTDEQQEDLFISDMEDGKNQYDWAEDSQKFANTESTKGNGTILNEKVTTTGGSVDVNQSETIIITKDKALKTYVKTNIENVFDLLAIYKASSQDIEMSNVAKMAIEDYLNEIAFNDLDSALNSDSEPSKKLKLSAMLLNEEGNIRGSVMVKGLNEEVNLDYIINSTETAYGTSRKFKIVGVN